MLTKPTHWPPYVEVCPGSWSPKLPVDWGTQFQQTLLHAEDDRDNACLQYKGITGESTFFQYCVVRAFSIDRVLPEVNLIYYNLGSTALYHTVPYCDELYSTEMN